MSLLKEMLNHKASDDNTLILNLSNEIGCTPQSIIEFKDEKTDEFANFDLLIRMVKWLDSDNEITIMIDYMDNLEVHNSTARYMLEYLSVNRKFDKLLLLIERMKDSTDPKSRLWAQVYLLQYEWQIGSEEIDLDQFMLKVESLHTSNSLCMQILQKLLKCYVYDQKKQHTLVFEISSELESLIEKMNDPYLKRIFQVKNYEVLSNIKLVVLNDSNAARYYASKVLEANIGAGFNSYANYIIGQSYFYTSYSLAKEFFLKSADLYNSINRNEVVKDVEKTIVLLDVYWGHKEMDNSFLIHDDMYLKARSNIETDLVKEK